MKIEIFKLFIYLIRVKKERFFKNYKKKKKTFKNWNWYLYKYIVDVTGDGDV